MANKRPKWTCTLHPTEKSNAPARGRPVCCRAYERALIDNERIPYPPTPTFDWVAPRRPDAG